MSILLRKGVRNNMTSKAAFPLSRLFIFNLFLAFFESVVSSTASNIQFYVCFTWCQTFLVHKRNARLRGHCTFYTSLFVHFYQTSCLFLFGYGGTRDPSAHQSL